MLLKKGVKFVWKSKHALTFEQFKKLLLSFTVLAFPHFDALFGFGIDTFSKGLGYMLYQLVDDGSASVIRFRSKTLHGWQQPYGCCNCCGWVRSLSPKPSFRDEMWPSDGAIYSSLIWKYNLSCAPNVSPWCSLTVPPSWWLASPWDMSWWSGPLFSICCWRHAMHYILVRRFQT